MQNSTKRGRFRGKIKYFFKETFRARSRAEYSEIFSRGLKDSGGEQGASYPWFYTRVLAALIALFAVVALTLYISGNRMGYPTALLFAGFLFNVPALLLVYELYPKRDFSLVAVVFSAVVGGTLAIVIVMLLYAAYMPQNDWLSTLYVGFVEEGVKALAAGLCIAVLRRRDSFTCIIIAVAVAIGFSVSEDMGYVFVYSSGYRSVFTDSLVEVSFGRAVMAVCTHATWTGLIIWAFFTFKRPLKNFRFYLIFLVAVALHFLWDLPVEGIISIFVVGACTVVGIMAEVLILRREIKKTSPENEEIINTPPLSHGEKLAHASRLTGSFTVIAVCALALVFCYFSPAYEYERLTFTRPDDFINYMQCGLPLSADLNREYDPTEEDFAQYVEGGEVLRAVQKVEEGGYNYLYSYAIATMDDERLIELEDVYAVVDGTRYRLVNMLEDINFFIINPEVIGYGADGNELTVTLNTEYFRGKTEAIALTSTAAVIAVLGAATAVTLKIKSRRYKNG